MSFDSHSELQPHLLALTQITQWHADAHQLPLELRFAVREGALGTIRTAITGVVETQPPAVYTQIVTDAVLELARTENFSGSFTVRINASPGDQAIVKQTPLAINRVQPAPVASQPHQATISADGLHLRTALLKHGHTSGYSPQEITAEERERGIPFPPDLKFYRTLVREGVITQVEGQDIVASSPQADFGASAQESTPWKAPATADNAVQAVLNHKHWVEIAHSDSHLYAFDMAPGPTGTSGQIIARRIGETSVPVRVAHSLAQFVVGESLASHVAGASQENSQRETPFEQTVAWVGSVEPVAFPTLLGWAKIHTESRYHGVFPEREGTVSSDAGIGEQSATDLLVSLSSTPAVVETTEAESSALEDASALSPWKPTTHTGEPFTASHAEITPNHALESGEQSNAESESGKPTPQDSHEGSETGKADTPGAIFQVSHIDQAMYQGKIEREMAEAVHVKAPASPAERDAEILDSDMVYPPISPEQKNIAATIGTLAFGTKEQREEYRATDTNPIPTIDVRGKTLSLTSASPDQVAAQRDGKQAENNLRSTLRKLFTSD